jgi:hypothetical protein
MHVIRLLTRFPSRFLVVAAFAGALASLAPPAHAEMIGGNPGPAHNYICPYHDGGAPLDCYFEAVVHLYTMCKHVKSIEIIEFGYAKATEGTNGAKSEYCLIKQRQNMVKPYQAAMRDAAISQQATEAMKSLQDYWLTSMQALEWRSPETDDEYKARTMVPYDRFKERIAGIKEIMDIVKTRTTPAPAAPPASKKGKR